MDIHQSFAVTGYKIKVGSGNRLVARTQIFLLYGSNNGTDWTVVDDKDSSTNQHQIGWTGYQERIFL